MTKRRALAGLAAGLVVAASALAQAPAHPSSAPVVRSGGVKSGAAPKVSTRPAWRELSPGEQRALAPLAAQWDTLNEAQKRKWLALSVNYPKMSGEEQAKLHSRMSEWVTLSPQQRTMARLNYGETRKISPGDRKAKWEAYQALTPEEKKKLAAGATTPKPPTTAAAVRPVPRDKLATLPRTRPNLEAKTPRIAAAPNQVDANTLLPHPPREAQPEAAAPQPAPVPAEPRPLPPQAGTPD
jgi:hypothetical protein